MCRTLTPLRRCFIHPQAVAECDLNPLTRQTLAASDATVHLKVTFLKAGEVLMILTLIL
jgi:hypothetical protein